MAAISRASNGLHACVMGAVLAVCMAVSGAALAAPASHPPIADKPCDPDYFESMKSEAWMQAQKQITQNQNQIYKPRSVLEMTCFNKYAGAMAKNSKDMLSGTKRWGDEGNDQKLVDDMNKVSGDAYTDYLDANFPKDKNDPLKVDSDRPSGGDDAIKEESYNCDMMNRVSEAARCEDFAENPETDGFYTNEEYANSDDKRQLPEQCEKDNRWDLNLTNADHETAPYEKDDADYKKPTYDDCGDSKYPPVLNKTTVRISGKDYPAGSCSYIDPRCEYKPETGKCQKQAN